MRERNKLRCPLCGFEILTEASYRYCAKCDTKMKFIEKENEN